MWKYPRCWLFVTVGLFGALPVGFAQVALLTPSPGESETEEIVVSATRIATPIDQIGSSLTVITADEIQERQRRTLPDLLQTVPGLNIVQTGGPGGKTSVFTRGSNSNHTKVLIDGVDANDPSQDGVFDFGQVLTSDIERVEVLRGPQSSLYGSDALGGVINIITKKGDGPPKFTGTLEGGSFDTFNQTAGVSGSTTRLNYAFNVAHFRVGETPVTPLDLLPLGRKRNDDAFNVAHFRVGETPVTPLDLLPLGRKRNDDSYENTTLSTRLGADFTDTFGVNLVARYTDSFLEFTSDDFSVSPSVPAADQSEQHAQQLFTRGEAHLSLFDGKFKNTVGLGYTYYRTEIQAPDTGFGVPPPNLNHGDRIKFDWQGNIALAERYTLLLGVEDQNDRLLESPISAENGNAAGFAEVQSEILHDLFAAASVRYDENERFGGKATWRIAPAYLVPKIGTKLKASYGTGFKAPSLTQLFVDFPAFNFFANPNLRPEESEGYDFGFEQPLIEERIRFGATYFHNEITNLINPNATFTSLENVGRATTEGVEVFASLTLTERFQMRVDYTYTDATDDTTGLELLRRPKYRASLTATWRPLKRLTLSTTMLYVGSQVDGNRSFSIPRLNTDSYFVVNLAAEYDLGKGVTLFARADNLLSHQYEDPTGFQRPGFGVFGGVRVNFDTKRSSTAAKQETKENSK